MWCCLLVVWFGVLLGVCWFMFACGVLVMFVFVIWVVVVWLWFIDVIGYLIVLLLQMILFWFIWIIKLQFWFNCDYFEFGWVVGFDLVQIIFTVSVGFSQYSIWGDFEFDWCLFVFVCEFVCFVLDFVVWLVCVW